MCGLMGERARESCCVSECVSERVGEWVSRVGELDVIGGCVASALSSCFKPVIYIHTHIYTRESPSPRCVSLATFMYVIHSHACTYAHNTHSAS